VRRPATFLRILLGGLGSAVTVCAVPASAESDTAIASIAISDGLRVTTLQPVSVAGATVRRIGQPGSVLSATATIEIRGRSDQAYGVSLSPVERGSDAVAVEVEDLAAWSENASGNLGSGLAGRTDSAGRDVVRLSGKVRLPHEVTSRRTTAAMTLCLDYQ
jgi:hypothetical protein